MIAAGVGTLAFTLPHLLRARTHGLYWDDGRTWTFERWPALCKDLRALKIDHIIVNTNGSEAAKAGRASGRWSAEQLRRLQTHDAPNVHAMVWAAPTAAFANDFRTFCQSLAKANIRVVELDIERDAWGEPVRGFASREAAAATLVDIAHDAGLTVGVTMIPSRLYAGFHDADYLVPQAYSKYANGAANHDAGGYYAPKNMQDRAARAAANAYPRLPLVLALAAHDQRWPAGPFANLHGMDVAYHAARQHSKSIRWWSSKWVVGHRADPQVKERIRKMVRNHKFSNSA